MYPLCHAVLEGTPPQGHALHSAGAASPFITCLCQLFLTTRWSGDYAPATFTCPAGQHRTAVRLPCLPGASIDRLHCEPQSSCSLLPGTTRLPALRCAFSVFSPAAAASQLSCTAGGHLHRVTSASCPAFLVPSFLGTTSFHSHHTAHCTLYPAHCTLHTVPCALYTTAASACACPPALPLPVHRLAPSPTYRGEAGNFSFALRRPIRGC